MKKITIAAGIILFNPDSERLSDNIDAIYKDVDKIYIYNNSADKDLVEGLQLKEKVVLLGKGENIGIASAMNAIFKQAKLDTIDWVVTFDQDSVSSGTLIDSYRKAINTHKKVAIFCPQVIDLRRKYMEPITNDLVEKVNRCITSASCTNVKAWENIGGFDDYLFIDLVDNDFCKRLIINGWTILRLNGEILNQEFGVIEYKNNVISKLVLNTSKFVRKYLGLSYLADNIGKLTYRKKVSPMRVYYTNRNILYLNNKFKKYDGIGYDCYKCKTYFGFWIVFNLPSVIRSNNKIAVIKAIVRGVADGRKKIAMNEGEGDIYEVKKS